MPDQSTPVKNRRTGDDGLAPDPDRQPARWAAQQDDATREPVRRAFVDPDGRLRALPAKHTKRLLLLDLVAQDFVPGQRYTEPEVNALLRAWFDDPVTLRRYLVENLFLGREAGWYWRTGGTVALDDITGGGRATVGW